MSFYRNFIFKLSLQKVQEKSNPISEAVKIFLNVIQVKFIEEKKVNYEKRQHSLEPGTCNL